jgi:hypothetical protein
MLMTNAAASHARDALQFMVAARAQEHGFRGLVLLDLLRGLGPAETVRMALALERALRVVDSLVSERYFSRSPFTLGPFAAKLRFEPPHDLQVGFQSPNGRRDDNFLREDLARRLQRGPVIWDLKVQRYVDPVRTPIEDGSVEWKDSDAAPETVAQLVIPQQDLMSDAAHSIAEAVNSLQFDPWNCAGGLTPLGSLNRARRVVYPVSAEYRAGRAPDEPPEDSAFWDAVWSLTEGVFRVLNQAIPWHHLPPFIGAVNLAMYRRQLRRENLHDTSKPVAPVWPPQVESRFLVSRASDGRFNDLAYPAMGASGTRFGRNVPLDHAFPGPPSSILEPNPREISERLLARTQFAPAATLNLLAAAWIQFQVHDWINHAVAGPEDVWRIPVPGADPWGAPEIVVRRTARDGTRTPAEDGLPPTYLNQDSHWWDGSQIYGSDQATTDRLRSRSQGKLSIDRATHFLPVDPTTGIPITGFSDNWWVGLTIMHNLFAEEHNSICDMLLRAYPGWPDERVFDLARLINVALMAKIHTVEWTPAILAHPTLQIGMNANWWGLEGQDLQRSFGRLSGDEVISGIPGSNVNQTGAPYALTEEFVSVYRLHPLIPDQLHFRHVGEGAASLVVDMADAAFGHAEDVFTHGYSLADVIYSFATTNPGAVQLHNYPQFLRDLHLPEGAERGDHLDLAAVDILRDRERGVPRYNEFRQLLHRGRVRKFEDITPNQQWADELKAIYHDVDQVDLMVGMFAESPPEGFGFSDTAFRIFILMASRRLKSDRFFTTDWRPEVYTQEGMEWISNNGMKRVLLRHWPALAPALRSASNPFAPWA